MSLEASLNILLKWLKWSNITFLKFSRFNWKIGKFDKTIKLNSLKLSHIVVLIVTLKMKILFFKVLPLYIITNISSNTLILAIR